MRSRHLAKGGHRNAPRFSLDAQLIHVAAGGDVEKNDLVGQCGYQLIAAVGECGFWPMDVLRECGKQQQAAIVDAVPPVLVKPHAFDTPCRADDNGLPSAQQDFQALLLNRRMKTTDDAASFVPQVLGLIIG